VTTGGEQSLHKEKRRKEGGDAVCFQIKKCSEQSAARPSVEVGTEEWEKKRKKESNRGRKKSMRSHRDRKM